MKEEFDFKMDLDPHDDFQILHREGSPSSECLGYLFKDNLAEEVRRRWNAYPKLVSALKDFLDLVEDDSFVWEWLNTRKLFKELGEL